MARNDMQDAARSARPVRSDATASLGIALRATVAGLLIACCAPASASPPPWPDAPYSYFATNVKLETVLADFAASFSLSLSMAPDVSGNVNGRYSVKSPSEFISKLGGIYGFVWYTHSGTLFVSRASDIVTRGITVPAGLATSGSGAASIRRALTDLNVLEPRFGWGEIGELAVVSGPPSYVNMVESTVRNLPARAQTLQIFRLKHASAEDRSVAYRDAQITTPGVATILRNLLSGTSQVGANAQATALAQQLRAAPTAPALGGMAAAAGSSAPAASGGSAGAASGSQGSGDAASSGRAGRGAVSIQSDPRLNAVLIQDAPERMALYQKLIDQLDIPTVQIEIEAMIIDVSTDRERDLGISWSTRAGNKGLAFGTPSPGASGAITFVRGGSADATTLSVPAGNYLLAQIRALEQTGDAQVQSRPAILTGDNMGALLDLSETFYIRTVGERAANVTPVTTGVTLRVTPRLIEDDGKRMVELKVDIEDGQITDRQIDALPTVKKSNVSTQAIVLENETLLIAGYTSDQNTFNNSRVPGLGEIPGIGALFSTKQRVVKKSERMFMIRPKVVAVGGASTPMPTFQASPELRKPL